MKKQKQNKHDETCDPSLLEPFLFLITSPPIVLITSFSVFVIIFSSLLFLLWGVWECVSCAQWVVDWCYQQRLQNHWKTIHCRHQNTTASSNKGYYTLLFCLWECFHWSVLRVCHDFNVFKRIRREMEHSHYRAQWPFQTGRQLEKILYRW